MKMRVSLLMSAIAVLVHTGFAQQPPGPPASRTPAVQSPEVHPDRRVSFRIHAPKATEVTVSGEFEVGAPAHKMTRDAQGVWSVTVGPFEPEIYEYDFIVDGVQMLDPRNPAVKYNRGPAAISSLLDIPGHNPRPFDTRRVAHGKVDIRYYDSKTTQQARRVHIYTPPNYERTTSRLPVLYLLHGGDGEDSVWTAFGRANAILDNLIADKTVPPMIVVMPNGYAYGWDSGTPGDQQQRDFERDLVEDLIPFVQANYRASSDRKHRALAGLSRGGGQTLSIGLRRLDVFSRLGVFSAGSNNPQEAFKDVAASTKKVNQQLDLLWIGCGTDDFAMPGAKRLTDFLSATGIEHTFRTTGGEHTWIVWRQYLREFAPLLWNTKRAST
jgi:enterochelin esterase family protein